MAEAECRRAADAAEQAYNAAFNKNIASEEATLNSEHQRCMTLARQAYAEGAIGERTYYSHVKSYYLLMDVRIQARKDYIRLSKGPIDQNCSKQVPICRRGECEEGQ